MTLGERKFPEIRNNPHWVGCACVVCGRHYGPDHDGFVCIDCGPGGILDAAYDLEAAGHVIAGGAGFSGGPATGLWRFGPLLPIQVTGDHPAWTVGNTPLLPADRLARHLGLKRLLLKDDTGLPSASLKDRAAVVAIARAVQLGLDHIACASTGNAAASLAVLAARAGLSTTIFVPKAAPKAKMAQLILHGATVVPVDGTYDQAFDHSLILMKENGWYSRNCAHNPLLVEGKKTVALEMALTLTDGFCAGDAALPDVVLVPVGDGCIVSSVAKAFLELHALGLIRRVPRVIGVQSSGSDALAAAWARRGNEALSLQGPEILSEVVPVQPDTIADSISVGLPRNRVKAWKMVASTGGGFLSVPDETIVEAIRLLAATAGLFAEPSGAAGLAGVVAAQEKGWIEGGESVAVLVTGHGLKDPTPALDGMSMPSPVSPRS